MTRALRLLFLGAIGAASAAPSAAPNSPPTPSLQDSLRNQPPSADKTTKPTTEEWKAAPEIYIERRGERAKDCHVWRVREWLRVSCPKLVTAAIAMLGGDPNGTAFWIDPPSASESKLPAGGEALFPVRRGDARVIQFLTFGPGYEGPYTHLPALVVQEYWPEASSHPIVMLY